MRSRSRVALHPRWRPLLVAAAVVVPVLAVLTTPILAGARTLPATRQAPPVHGLYHSGYGRSQEGSSLVPAWQSEQEPEVDGDRQDRLTIVRGDDVPGRGPGKPWAAMRAELRPYDGGNGDVQDGKYNRAEVYARHARRRNTPADRWPDPIGSTRWYSWALLVPEGFEFDPTGSKWLSVTQWKGQRGGTPELAVEIKGDQLELGGAGPRSGLGPLVPGVWTHLIIGVHFRPDDEGWVEVWRDGRNVLPRTYRATQQSDRRGRVDPTYLKQGIYRTRGWTTTHVVFHGSMTITDQRPTVWHHKLGRGWTRIAPPG